MKLLALGSLLLATACLPATPEAASQSAITGGSNDTGDHAVAMIHGQSDAETSTCTATFLSSRVLLSAAHCFADSAQTYTVGPDSSYDLTDPTNLGGSLYGIASVAIDPAYDPSSALPHPHDLAVVKLSSDAGKTTLPFHAAALDASFVGQPLRLVGYGRTSPGLVSEGTRRAVDTTLGALTSADLVVTSGKQDCGGDSGGPALMTIDGIQTIVGVAESATTDCKTRGYYGRLDGDIEFIDAELASSGSSSGGTTGGTSGGAQVGGCSTAGSGAPRLFGMFALLIALGLRRRA